MFEGIISILFLETSLICVLGRVFSASHICEFSLFLNSSVFIFALYLPYAIFGNPHLFI